MSSFAPRTFETYFAASTLSKFPFSTYFAIAFLMYFYIAAFLDFEAAILLRISIYLL